ncbi:MAG: tetratricopeptide repeat protein [Micavibrio sp.]
MKKALMLSTALIAISMPAVAQNYDVPPTQVNSTQAQTVQDPMMEQIATLQNEWARIKYQMPDEDAQLAAISALEKQAAAITANYSNRAEPKIWEAIILSTEAGIIKGMSALPKVKQAKELLESAEALDSNALEGSAHTSLGSLYYQVPGWPVGFGDDDEAEKHLKQALQINPTGIDPNFFYGDFLLQDDRYDEAKAYLERALQAPARPGRELADAGRRQEIKAALAKAGEKLNSHTRQFN